MWTKWKARQQVFTLGPSKHTGWPPYMCTGISAAHSVGLSDQLLLCSAIVQSVFESGEPGESPRDKEHNKKGLTLRPLWGTGVTSEVFHIGHSHRVMFLNVESLPDARDSILCSCSTTIYYCYLLPVILVDSFILLWKFTVLPPRLWRSWSTAVTCAHTKRRNGFILLQPLNFTTIAILRVKKWNWICSRMTSR